MNKDEEYQGIKMTDVWGEYDDNHNKVSSGMIIAKGIPYEPDSPEGKELIEKTGYPAICPVLEDTLPYKSVSVECKLEDQQAVEYWLEYVHGGGCIEGTAEAEDGKTVFIRSNYMCW